MCSWPVSLAFPPAAEELDTLTEVPAADAGSVTDDVMAAELGVAAMEASVAPPAAAAGHSQPLVAVTQHAPDPFKAPIEQLQPASALNPQLGGDHP